MCEHKSTIRRILDRQSLDHAVGVFVATFPDMAGVAKDLHPLPLRFRAPGFEGLAEIITAQQVSKASAAAIFERTRSKIQPFEADTLLALGAQCLVDAGQSRTKQATLMGLAEAIVHEGLDVHNLCDLPVEQAMEELTRLKGIGPWTAEVFLLFCAGHTDIFPAGDIALQQATADILGLSERPDAKATRALAGRWAPMRSVAARILYAHYAWLRGKSAI